MKADIFEAQKLTRGERKRMKDRVYYFQKNRERLLASLNRGFSFHQYDVVPIRDYYDLEYKIDWWPMLNPYVDRNNFKPNMALSLYNYLHESTKSVLAKEALMPLVVSYDHSLFYTFFMLKLIKSENYLIPLILDYHFDKYKNTSAGKNSKKNKDAFLSFVEHMAIANLEHYSPFNHEAQGIEMVKWLREKKRKFRNTTPEHTSKTPPNKDGETVNESLDIKLVLQSLAIDHFKGMEKAFIKAGYILSKSEEEIIWIGSKEELLAMILLMNTHRYFYHDILNVAQKKFKKQVKLVFENRYKINLKQYFEKARTEHIVLRKFDIKRPFSRIAHRFLSKIFDPLGNRKPAGSKGFTY